MPIALGNPGLGCDCGKGVQPRWNPGMGIRGLGDATVAIPNSAPQGTYYDPSSGEYLVPYEGPAPSYAGPGPGAQTIPGGLNMFGAPVGFIPEVPGEFNAEYGPGGTAESPVHPQTQLPQYTAARTDAQVQADMAAAMASTGAAPRTVIVPTNSNPNNPAQGSTPVGTQISIAQQNQQAQIQASQMQGQVIVGGSGNAGSTGATGGAPVSIQPTGILASIGGFFSSLTPTELLIGAGGLVVIGLMMFGSGGGPGGKFRIYGG